MNRAAQALGRLAKGVPKTLTRAQRRQRREQLAAARRKRWARRRRPSERPQANPVAAPSPQSRRKPGQKQE